MRKRRTRRNPRIIGLDTRFRLAVGALLAAPELVTMSTWLRRRTGTTRRARVHNAARIRSSRPCLSAGSFYSCENAQQEENDGRVKSRINGNPN